MANGNKNTNHKNNSEIHFLELFSIKLAIKIEIGANKNMSSLPFLLLVKIIKISPINTEKRRIQYLDFSFKGVFEIFINLYITPNIPNNKIKIEGIIVFNE